jgi:hypothetical protein
MSLLTAWNYTFADGIGSAYVASGAEVMSDFNQVKNILNALDETNITAASKVLCTDRVKTVSAILTFSANPVFNAAGIADASLTSNVPLKNAANTMSGNNTFSGDNTFTKPVLGFIPPTLVAHPSTAGDDGKVYLYSGGLYIYKHGTGAVSLDYNGAYTGGAVKSYSGEITIDPGSPAIIMIKTDSTITTAKMKLVGFEFPTYPYTELGQHSHAVGTLALTSGAVSGTTHTHSTTMGSHTHAGAFGSSTHTHAGASHRHTWGQTTDTGAATATSHRHTVSLSGNTGDTGIDEGSTALSHSHTVSLSGNSGYESTAHTHGIDVGGYSGYEGTGATGAPSLTTSVSSTDLGAIASGNNSAISPTVGTAVSGTTDNAGVSGGSISSAQKVNMDTALQVYITSNLAAWGTVKDSGTAGWSSLANILAASGGTDEIDISSYLATSSFNYIKVVEPTAAKGGRLAYHIEIV